ncbi:MAG: DUF6250 domain-containing protein [Ignavibacteriales bacterium]|nr:DUF6250 domain-containing protein [Ignavibacteriales bacterium]
MNHRTTFLDSTDLRLVKTLKRFATLNRICAVLLFLSTHSFSQSKDDSASVVWTLDNTSSIGGYPVTVAGSPFVKPFDEWNAVVFDGIDDGLIVQGCPLNKSSEFTIEIIFKPDSSFPTNAEQRFLHVQKPNMESRRMLIELRLSGPNRWFVDTHIRADSARLTCLAEKFPHPVDEWYHAALVYRNGKAAHFVNGQEEMSGSIDYIPVDSASVALGMRMNQKSFFKGAIRTVRLTRRALVPSEFLTVPASTASPGYRTKQLLFSDDFQQKNNNWVAECEEPSTSAVLVRDGKLDISVSAGATVWFTKKLSGNIMITYDAVVKDEGGIYDRVSDLNAFWMATDAKKDSLRVRFGKFSAYDNLNLYYAGIGGHDNTTTRFRKYSSSGENPVLKEYLDKEHLLKGNMHYSVMIVVCDGRTQFFLNGELFFDYADTQLYREGYFGFRTTKSHQLMDNFKVYQLSNEK